MWGKEVISLNEKDKNQAFTEVNSGWFTKDGKEYQPTGGNSEKIMITPFRKLIVVYFVVTIYLSEPENCDMV